MTLWDLFDYVSTALYEHGGDTPVLLYADMEGMSMEPESITVRTDCRGKPVFLISAPWLTLHRVGQGVLSFDFDIERIYDLSMTNAEDFAKLMDRLRELDPGGTACRETSVFKFFKAEYERKYGPPDRPTRA